MKAAVFLFLTCLLASGCIKIPEIKLYDPDKPKFDGVTCAGQCFILSGQIVDTPAHNRLEGLELKFYYHRFHGLIDYLGTTRTDVNGNYVFRFDALDYLGSKGSYFISYKNGGYMQYEYTDDRLLPYFHLDSTHINRVCRQDFSLFRTMTLRVRIFSNQADIRNIKFERSFGRGLFSRSFDGPGPIDYSFDVMMAAGVPTAFGLSGTVNGKYTKENETVTIPADYGKVYEMNL